MKKNEFYQIGRLNVYGGVVRSRHFVSCLSNASLYLKNKKLFLDNNLEKS